MFLVAGQASKASGPGKGAFHLPAFGPRHEAPRGRGLAGQLMLRVQVGQAPHEHQLEADDRVERGLSGVAVDGAGLLTQNAPSNTSRKRR